MKDFPDSLFKAAFKITNNGMVILNSSYPIEVNDQFLGILKRSRKEIIGNDLLSCVFKDDIALAKEEIRKNRQIIYEVRFIRGDGSLAHVEVRGHPIMYKGKKCRMLIIRDITMKIINERLFLNYLNILEAFPEPICVHDFKGKILYINPSMNKLFGARSAKQVVGEQVMKYVLPEFHSILRENKQKLRQLKSTTTQQVTIRSYDDKYTFKVELSALPLNWGGETAVLAACHDMSLEEKIYKSEVERQVVEAVNERLKWEISEHHKLENKLKEMVEEKEWLLKEVNHRVKNNLQIITSILNLQINQLQDKKIVPVMKEFQNRFYALSSIYSSLYQSDNKEEIDISAYLKDLTKNLFISYSDPHKNISLGRTDRIFLEYSQAITCGLIVNELVSNSIKYAFPGNRKGEVKVSLRQSGQNIRLEVSDDGVGIQSPIEKHAHETLGLQLVESLVKQLNDGKFKRRKITKGMGYIITFTSESYSKKENEKVKAAAKK